VRRGSRARIECISVTNLFGFLSYEIPAKSAENLIILYGDNGTGKTTLLNLVFHALAPEDQKGHRTFIAHIPLERLAIDFADGHRLSVTRKSPLSGSFTMRVEKQGQEIVSHHFELTREGAVRDQKEATYRPLIHALSDLNLGLFLLPDDRKIQSNLYPDDEPLRHRYLRRRQEVPPREALDVERAREEQGTVDTLVQEALNRSVQWARRNALTATSQGETDTTKMYADILARIAGSASTQRSSESIPFTELPGKLESLRQRSMTFSRFGLVTSLVVRDILPLLQHASPRKRGLITQVLSPYLRSFEARLDALEGLSDTLETFSRIFSRFYNQKTLTFNVRTGININLRHDSSRLAPDVLSSGEKQLLLLFCNVLLARSRPSVFIIDEPELSLNVKWQRELISSLMSCVKGCDVQFVLATHSLEMISLHKASVVKLEVAS